MYKQKLTSQLVKNGKTRLAQRIITNCFCVIEQHQQRESSGVLTSAVTNVTPVVEVKPRRIGGSVFQVPVQVFPERGNVLAIRWIVQSAKTRASGRGIASKLAGEILDASENTGGAVKKRESIHKMAEANKAFAHYG
jgi:small subunit ribosomal protein S7